MRERGVSVSDFRRPSLHRRREKREHISVVHTDLLAAGDLVIPPGFFKLERKEDDDDPTMLTPAVDELRKPLLIDTPRAGQQELNSAIFSPSPSRMNELNASRRAARPRASSAPADMVFSPGPMRQVEDRAGSAPSRPTVPDAALSPPPGWLLSGCPPCGRADGLRDARPPTRRPRAPLPASQSPPAASRSPRASSPSPTPRWAQASQVVVCWVAASHPRWTRPCIRGVATIGVHCVLCCRCLCRSCGPVLLASSRCGAAGCAMTCAMCYVT